jgi:hypothetical protein
MKVIIAVVALAVGLGAGAIAQPPAGDTLPVGATRFVCRWGTEPAPHGGQAFLIENGAMVTEQTDDKWTILQNNQFGLVATQSMSEFVPRLNRKIVAFWTIAIDRTTGKAVMASGDTAQTGGGDQASGTCTARQ